MQLKLINKKIINNKKILIRVDYNVPLKNKIIQDDRRIQDSLKTINFLLKNQAKQIILVAHLGRPGGKADPKLSLKPIADYLSKLLKQPVAFNQDFSKDAICFDSAQHRHRVSLLENIRFNDREKKNCKRLAKKLASLADIYINDAFSVSHRAHSSVSAITEYLPSYAGFALNNEVKMLSKLLENPKRPLVILVGGAKISDKISAIKNLAQIADTVLVGGGVANNFLEADDFDVANSYLEEKNSQNKKQNFVKFADDLLDSNQQEHSLLANYIPLPKIIYPIDVLAAKSPDAKTNKIINLLNNNQAAKSSDMFLDIGPKTIQLFSQVIKQAKTIFWNGPMGVFENSEFETGTKKIARAVANSKAMSVLGGGDTISAIKKFDLENKYSYVSAAGGAALEFLSGKRLPGLLSLEIKN